MTLEDPDSVNASIVLEVATTRRFLASRAILDSGKVNIRVNLSALAPDGSIDSYYVETLTLADIRDGGQLGVLGLAGGHPLHLYKGAPDLVAVEALNAARIARGALPADGTVYGVSPAESHRVVVRDRATNSRLIASVL